VKPRIRPATGSGIYIADMGRQVEREIGNAIDAFRAIRTITASAAISASDYTVLADAAAGAVTVTLPAASTVTGQTFHVKKIDATANAVTLDGNGAETIDGAATKATTTQWASYSVQSNGTGWFIL